VKSLRLIGGVTPEGETMKSKRRGSKQRKPSIRHSMDDDPVFMLPWYLPKETYLAVRRILPNIHITKMRYYFEDYGCMRCERRDVLYRTNGLCESCNAIVRWRLAHCLEKRMSKVGITTGYTPGGIASKELLLAQGLLKRFSRTKRH
jgi:hypothetical protein